MEMPLQQEEKTGWVQKARIWYQEYRRVLTVTKKPTKEEYITVVKVSGLGILAVGIIGFFIQMLKIMLFS